jgi:sulfate adenylyltransferase
MSQDPTPPSRPAPGSHPLPTPYGGALVDLQVDAARARELAALAIDLPSWTLTPRQVCDFELLAQGAFSPLDGFMDSATVRSVCFDMQLPGGALWPLPVSLDVPAKEAEAASKVGALALRDADGLLLGVVQAADVFEHARREEAEACFGTTSREHPGVRHWLERANNFGVGGRLEALRLPPHFDFADLRATPAELRARFAARGWDRVVAFQTRNPLHRAHFELTLRAARESGANLLLHPVIGPTQPGDLDAFTRVRCYRALMPHYPPGLAELALLPLAMRMAGPREALLHAIIRRNYGCGLFVVGRDHAGPVDRQGKSFYAPLAAQELASRHAAELGVEILPYGEMRYSATAGGYVTPEEADAGHELLALSGGAMRKSLAEGKPLPEFFTFPEVAKILAQRYPPRWQRGLTVFFTGLSGAGKSTLAHALVAALEEGGERAVTLLDGDLVRRHLSSELGFSKEHRDLNVRRIGWVASEITKAGGVAVCAPIAPYDAIRREVRALVEEQGSFVLLHVSTPLEVCEQRDVKGLYAKARAGIIPTFTGVSDPYEVPADAELVLDTSQRSPEECLADLLGYLRSGGYLAPAEGVVGPA